VNILVVDDHILFREGLVTMLQTCPDFRVIGEAGSAVEAVEKVSNLRPDLVLLDIGLPDGDGLDVMKVLRMQCPEVKVVMLTVHDTDDHLVKAIRSGANGYLLKTMPMSQVLASIRGVQRGEMAISRKMTRKLLDQFTRQEGEQDELDSLNALTVREMDVLKQLSAGNTNRQIAKRLFISENTVKIHVHNILKKLRLRTRREAGRYASLLGISRYTQE
jgi:DNA-binding NarL/FixJ family response regulator